MGKDFPTCMSAQRVWFCWECFIEACALGLHIQRVCAEKKHVVRIASQVLFESREDRSPGQPQMALGVCSKDMCVSHSAMPALQQPQAGLQPLGSSVHGILLGRMQGGDATFFSQDLP